MGNLAAKRDWGYAPEYVEAMWRMLQQDEADDLVIGTGETHSVQEFLDEAFAYADLDPGKYVEIDQRYFRPTEVDVLLADASKAKRKLNWEPKVTFKDLVRIMVDADMESVGLELIGEGRKIMQERFTGWHQWDTSVAVALKNERHGVE